MISYLCTYNIEKLCSKCGLLYNDDVKHLVFDCAALYIHWISLYAILCTKPGSLLTNYVLSLNAFEQLGVLVGGPCVRLESLSQNDYDSFLECSILIYLSKIWQFKDTC